MSRNICILLAFGLLVGFLSLGCGLIGGEETPQPAPVVQAPMPMPAPPPPVQQPVPQPVAAPVAPPPTPLVPVGDDIDKVPEDNKPKPKWKKVDGIDKPIPGKATEGDELIGAYFCNLNSKELSLGPIKLPQFGCRIYRADDGKLRVGSSSSSIAKLRGTVESPTALGFFITGKYKFPGNAFKIKTRMKLKPGAKVVYSGKGRGTLNDDKKSKKKFTLVMTRK
ncbi:MAG: hypothetical protein GY854_09930 [Deltaproteobacteria bacterium]|nr:hypothetical protein [Deltaproteobacteria bacterium]